MLGGNGSVTTAALRPRSLKQPCPSQVTSKNPSPYYLHALGCADAHQVERRFESVTCGAAQLQASPGEIYIVDHHAMLAALVARVVEPMHSGRKILHVVGDAMRLEKHRGVLSDLRPERQLPRNIK